MKRFACIDWKLHRFLFGQDVCLTMEEIRIITKGRDLKKIGAKTFREYISLFVKERASITLQKIPTLAQEKKWLDNLAKNIDDNKALTVLLFIDGKLAGTCAAHRPANDGEGINVNFGLSIAKQHRGKGFGEKLLRRAIAEAKKRFKPHNLWIEHVEGNAVARKLYEKVGFAEVGRLEDYVLHYGKYKDKILMHYKGK